MARLLARMSRADDVLAGAGSGGQDHLEIVDAVLDMPASTGATPERTSVRPYQARHSNLKAAAQSEAARLAVVRQLLHRAAPFPDEGRPFIARFRGNGRRQTWALRLVFVDDLQQVQWTTIVGAEGVEVPPGPKGPGLHDDAQRLPDIITTLHAGAIAGIRETAAYIAGVAIKRENDIAACTGGAKRLPCPTGARTLRSPSRTPGRITVAACSTRLSNAATATSPRWHDDPVSACRRPNWSSAHSSDDSGNQRPAHLVGFHPRPPAHAAGIHAAAGNDGSGPRSLAAAGRPDSRSCVQPSRHCRYRHRSSSESSRAERRVAHRRQRTDHYRHDMGWQVWPRRARRWLGPATVRELAGHGHHDHSIRRPVGDLHQRQRTANRRCRPHLVARLPGSRSGDGGHRSPDPAAAVDAGARISHRVHAVRARARCGALRAVWD